MNASDSYEIELTIYEADGVTPLDYSTASGFLISIYQKPNHVVARFSKVVKSGFTTLLAGQIAQANVGKTTIYLNAEESKLLDPKKPSYAEFRVSMPNANFTGGDQVLTATEIELEDVVRPVMENISPT